MPGYEQEKFLYLSRGFNKIPSANKGQSPASYSWDHEFYSSFGDRLWCLRFTFFFLLVDNGVIKAFVERSKLLPSTRYPGRYLHISISMLPAIFDVYIAERGHLYKQVNKICTDAHMRLHAEGQNVGYLFL